MRGQDRHSATLAKIWADLNDADEGDPLMSASMREHAIRLAGWEKKKKSDYTPFTVQLLQEVIAQSEKDGSLIPLEKIDHIEVYPDRTIAVLNDGSEVDVTPSEMKARIKKMQEHDATLTKGKKN